MQVRPHLVLGATGKTGSRVAHLLEARGHAVRRAARGTDLPFDWEDRTTWAPVLAGVDAVYVSYFPDLAAPEAPERIAALVEEARAAGTGRLVLMSGRQETHALRCEAILRDSGLDHAVLRAAWFMQNFSEGYLHPAVMAGEIAMPAGDVAEPFVDVDDLAEVAVACMTDARHSGRIYDVTGPQALTFAEAAAMLGHAAGRPVAYRPVTLDAFHADIAALAGPEIADVFTAVCREVLDGRNATPGDGVRQVLGRAPRDFAGFCARMAAAGTWAEAA